MTLEPEPNVSFCQNSPCAVTMPYTFWLYAFRLSQANLYLRPASASNIFWYTKPSTATCEQTTTHVNDQHIRVHSTEFKSCKPVRKGFLTCLEGNNSEGFWNIIWRELNHDGGHVAGRLRAVVHEVHVRAGHLQTLLQNLRQQISQ